MGGGVVADKARKSLDLQFSHSFGLSTVFDGPSSRYRTHLLGMRTSACVSEAGGRSHMRLWGRARGCGLWGWGGVVGGCSTSVKGAC